jgi:putative tricarboxylic transport membrane protein
MKNKSLLYSLVGAAVIAASSQTAFAFEQVRSVACIAPSGPGGGWDFTCRSVGKLMSEMKMIDGNVQTTNMTGAGGGVAFAHVISKRADDSALIVAASTATTTRLAQGQFVGMDKDMVRWAGALGADYGVIAVAKDSPYQTLSDLMAALAKDPGAVKFAGGSAAGGWDHLKVLMAAKAAGVSNLSKITYLAYAGGAEAITQIVGGHIGGFTGDVSEAMGFMQSGDLRVLAVLSEERLPAPLDNIPTAREQNIDTVAPNWRGFYVPKGVSDDAYLWWVDNLDSIYGSEEWKQVMAQNGLMPFHKTGTEFADFVEKQVGEITAISTEVGLIK